MTGMSGLPTRAPTYGTERMLKQQSIRLLARMTALEVPRSSAEKATLGANALFNLAAKNSSTPRSRSSICPLDFCAFRQGERILDVDPEIANRAFYLRVAE